MVDLNVKVPALEKLVDYTASGIGAVAGPMLAPWKARKEAEARRIGAKAEADSLRLIADAQAEARHSLVESDEAGRGVLEIDQDGIRQRIEFQERKRQANIASVVRDAAAELGDKEVPDREPNHDWTARFFDGVQDVSSEDMRKLWAKVLSGEVEAPGRTSLRTLEILKNMTKEDAQVFRGVCDYVIDDFIFRPQVRQAGYPVLNLVVVMHLRDVGLLSASESIVRTLSFDQHEEPVVCVYGDFILKYVAKGNLKSIEVPAIRLTGAGMELSRVVECTVRMDYLQSFARFLQEKNVNYPTLASSRDILMGESRIRFLLFPSNPSRTNRATARHDSRRHSPDRGRVSAGAGLARLRSREECAARAHLDAAFLAGKEAARSDWARRCPSTSPAPSTWSCAYRNTADRAHTRRKATNSGGLLVAEAILLANGIQDLADEIPDLLQAAVGHDLKFRLRVEFAGETRPDTGAVEQVNALLAQVSKELKLS